MPLTYSFEHLHLIAPDPEKTAQWYEKAFGAKRVSATVNPDGRSRVELSLNGTRVLINNTVTGDVRSPDQPRKHSGLEHFGVKTDNLDTAVKDLKAMGTQFLQEITQARPGVRITFLMAPDNVLIELMEVK